MPMETCSDCGRFRLVSKCTKDGKYIGRFCADCFDRIDHDSPPRNKTSSGSGRNHNDPGFDNVVRSLEEDR